MTLKEHKAIHPIDRLRYALQEMNSIQQGDLPAKTWSEVRESPEPVAYEEDEVETQCDSAQPSSNP